MNIYRMGVKKYSVGFLKGVRFNSGILEGIVIMRVKLV